MLPDTSDLGGSSLHTFISLFSGCGGLDLGFVQEGFECLGAFDSDQAAVSAYNENICPRAIVADLSKGLPNEISLKPPPDLVLAGTPCQGFSLAGKRNTNDVRNSLLITGARLAIELRPRLAIFENVVAATRHPLWRRTEELFRSNGYATQTVIWSARAFAIPQERKRAFLFAAKNISTIDWSSIPRSNRLCNLADVLTRLSPSSDHQPQLLCSSSRDGLIASHIGPGMKLCNVRNSSRAVRTWDISKVFGSITASERRVLEALIVLRRRNRIRDFGDADPVLTRDISTFLGWSTYSVLLSLRAKGYVKNIDRRYDLRHTFNGKYRRLALDSVSPSVTTKFCDPTHFLHPLENRGLTVREAAAIQGFPISFRFDEGRSAKRLVGNAVPPPLGRTIASTLRSIS